MDQRQLGSEGLQVSSIGLGCMGMSWAYGPTDEAESLKVLARALEIGVNFWDTAEAYGPFKNEELLGKAFRGTDRSRLTVASKFMNAQPDGRSLVDDPKYVRKSLEATLLRLGTDYVDLYYQHRLDPKVPVEESVGQMGELVKEGKIRYLGLSEVSSSTLRKAHKIHPISVVQSEFSMWERTVETELFPTLEELGVGFVAYSPIGRGFLSGKIEKRSDLSPDDGRLSHPRFQEANIEQNRLLVDFIEEVAMKNDVTAAQVALAWVLRQSKHVVPIPGTKRVKYLEQNAAASDIQLSANDWEKLGRSVNQFKTSGERYPEAGMKTIDRS